MMRPTSVGKNGGCPFAFFQVLDRLGRHTVDQIEACLAAKFEQI